MANNNNQKVVPGAEEALNRMKFEIASQVGVNLKQGYNGDLTAREAGKVGGNITKQLIQMAESQLAGK
ncbi:MAG: alpha/beta-type small acid-soluble spore protein [Clostridia bacterium]|nr:alpha/beta-type small acid-soluble spore protein [Clostridia bacterium]